MKIQAPGEIHHGLRHLDNQTQSHAQVKGNKQGGERKGQTWSSWNAHIRWLGISITFSIARVEEENDGSFMDNEGFKEQED